MTSLAPIALAHGVNHVRSPSSPPLWAGAKLTARYGWHDVEADALAAARRASARATFARFQKMRLWAGVPYHEWQEALILAGLRWQADYPTFRTLEPLRQLIHAYADDLCWDGSYEPAPRCAPWTAAERVILAVHHLPRIGRRKRPQSAL